MFLHEKILAEYEDLESKIQSIQKQIQTLPEGNLLCAKNGLYQKWYQNNNGTLTYIKKENQSFAQELALKKYLTYLLEEYTHEHEALHAYIQHHNSHPSKIKMFLSDSSEYAKLLAPHFKSFSAEIQEWERSDYERNPKYPEQLIHKTFSGNVVRSKSEVQIDTALFTHHIPYRYECVLHLDDFIFYPDFTIRHPASGKLLIWEHFGKMDDANYSKNAFSKLQIYNNHGFILSHNLIATFETADSPLTLDTIEEIITHYFL